MLYEEQIDEKKTIQKMRRYLEFLGRHLNSVSYQEYVQQQYPIIKEERKEYLLMNQQPWQEHRTYPDTHGNNTKEREMQIRWLCYGLQQLPTKQRMYLVERYVYHMEKQAILQKHGIVESTLNRNLRKACLHLAIILKLEVTEEV